MASIDPFDKQFRQKANDLRQQPSSQVWQKLENKLDAQHPAKVRQLKPWLMAAVILIVAGMVYLLNLPADLEQNPLAKRAESLEELDTPYQSDPALDSEDIFKSVIEDDNPYLDGYTPQGTFRDVRVSKDYAVKS